MCLSETQCPLLRRFEKKTIYHLAGLEIISLWILLLPLDFVFWPLTLNDELDLDLSPLKMCSSMRYTCMPNMKLLPSILQKLCPMLKFSDGQTDRRTDSSTAICHTTGGITIIKESSRVCFFLGSSTIWRI